MFLGTFLDNFESVEVFPFFKFFRVSTTQGSLGKIFCPKKLPRSMLKTCLNTFGNVFAHFEKMKIFQVFWSFSKFRPSRVHWARKNRKNYLEQVWTLLERFFGVLEVWNFFHFCGFFLVSRVHWAELFPSKKSVKTFSNNVFWERFWTILKISKFFLF